MLLNCARKDTIVFCVLSDESDMIGDGAAALRMRLQNNAVYKRCL